jgi:hypothetical protein
MKRLGMNELGEAFVEGEAAPFSRGGRSRKEKRRRLKALDIRRLSR